MREEIKVPQVGESIGEGDIARWYKEDGDMVTRDEPLAELETDKASMDITSPADGKLVIVETEGTTVEMQQIIGYIDTDAKADAKPAKSGEDEDDADDMDEEEEEDKAKHSTLFNFQMPSPAARKIMAEHNISAKDIPASGKGNRITKADVLRYLEETQKQDKVTSTVKLYRDKLAKAIEKKQADREAKAAPAERKIEAVDAPAAPKAEAKPAERPTPKAPTETRSTRVPGSRDTRVEKMTRMRKTISERLVNAQQTAALLTTFNEVDMSGIMNLRAQFKEEFKEKHQVGLGFMSFFTKAVTNALMEFPIINAQVEDEGIKYHDYADIGIAVSTPKGLVVPVIRNAETLTLREIEMAVLDLAKRGRDGLLSIDDMAGGTFSITNGGIFGSMLSTPILNAPQSAILGMHNIVQRPVAVKGEVVIRPIMYVALTYDHRIIDGSDAVRFLVKVKTQLEDPVRLLLEL